MNEKNKIPKLCIIGPARWGKDSMAEILKENFNLRFESTSQAASEILIYDALKDKYGYSTPIQCFEDRFNHRSEWYNLIYEYNLNDKARLAKEILKHYDFYVGMRETTEIKECIKQNVFDLIVWVDSSKRLPPEGNDSFNITESDADVIIDNNGTYDEFRNRVLRFGKILTH